MLLKKSTPTSNSLRHKISIQKTLLTKNNKFIKNKKTNIKTHLKTVRNIINYKKILIEIILIMTKIFNIRFK